MTDDATTELQARMLECVKAAFPGHRVRLWVTAPLEYQDGRRSVRCLVNTNHELFFTTADLQRLITKMGVVSELFTANSFDGEPMLELVATTKDGAL